MRKLIAILLVGSSLTLMAGASFANQLTTSSQVTMNTSNQVAFLDFSNILGLEVVGNGINTILST